MDDFHVTFLFVAFVGVTVAVKVKVLPFTTLAVVLFKVTFVTLTTGLVTVILQLAFTPLSSAAVAVMVAVPAATAVTTPLFSSTLAIFGLDDFHVTFLFVAFVGVTVAVNATVLPFTTLAVVLFKVIPVTLTVGTVTCTVQLAEMPLSSFAVAVMTVVPAFIAVTFPVGSTVATPSTLLLQVKL